MNPWHRLPFLRLVIPLITGILAGSRGCCHHDTLITGVLLLLIFLQGVLLVWQRQLLSFRSRWIPGALIQCFFFLSGTTMLHRYDPAHQAGYAFGSPQQSGSLYLIEVTNPLRFKEKSVRFFGKLTHVFDGDSAHAACGNLLVYMERDSLSERLGIKDRLIIRAGIKDIRGASVPSGFDYSKYLNIRGIHHQAYVASKQWYLFDQGVSWSVRRLVRACQQRLVALVREKTPGSEEEAVGCAMLLGYTDGFDPELQGAWTRAGVTHILAVSGLHVGLIFLIFSKFLFFLKKTGTHGIIRAVFLVALIWAYAFLTGLSPSVQRAALMFSMLIIARSFKRRNDILNSLAVSAFVLLWIRPVNLFDYGFQLSYLAVIGIVTIQPLLSNIWYIPIRMIDWIWQMVCVTIAAQLVTGPLAMLHFHQFPLWFIPANLMLIPVSTLAMYTGTGMLLLSWSPFLAGLAGQLFGLTLMLMNTAVKLTGSLPYSTLEGLYPAVPAVGFFYLLLMLFFQWIRIKKPSLFISVLLCLLGMGICNAGLRIKNLSTESAFIFTHRKMSVTGIRQGDVLYCLCPPELLADSAGIWQSLGAYCHQYAVSRRSMAAYSTLDGKVRPETGDVWILQDKSSISFIPEIERLRPERLILPPLVRKKKQWLGAAADAGASISDLKETGWMVIGQGE